MLFIKVLGRVDPAPAANRSSPDRRPLVLFQRLQQMSLPRPEQPSDQDATADGHQEVPRSLREMPHAGSNRGGYNNGECLPHSSDAQEDSSFVQSPVAQTVEGPESCHISILLVASMKPDPLSVG